MKNKEEIPCGQLVFTDDLKIVEYTEKNKHTERSGYTSQRSNYEKTFNPVYGVRTERDGADFRRVRNG